MNISKDEGFFMQQTVRRMWIPLFPLCTMYFVPRKKYIFRKGAALRRKKVMNGLVIVLIGIVALGAGYLFYGRWLAKKWGNRPKCKNPCLHTWGWRRLCSLLQIYRYSSHQFSSIAGARSCHRSDPCICFWMGSGIALAHHRRTFLRCCTGLRCFICIRKKWR